jgi:transposase
MANQIKMAVSDSILTLYERGWSGRRIARELDLNRETVSRHIRLRTVPEAKPATLPAGIGESGEAKPAKVPTGIGEAAEPKPAKVPAGISGCASLCRPYHEFVLRGVESGLTAQRIFQDLRIEQGFPGNYDTVKRYVRRLTAGGVESVERMECLPGEEAQVDFGLGAPVVTDGHRRRSWVFRIVLSHSRKGYSEAVFRQGTEEFIRCLENAFRAFGGVPKTLVIDNLRAAVTQADWYEPEVQPKMAAFCRHYGTVVLPTRPRHPEHKGKVERGVGYVKGNALKRRVFESLAEENAYLRRWEEQVADQRIHGTTRRHVGRCFEERERAALLPLPPMLFPAYEEGRRAVHRDSFVEVKHAYYAVPEEYVGLTVWARWDGRTVRIFNLRMEPIAMHARLEAGAFSPRMPGRNGDSGVRRTAEYWCQRAEQIGPWCGEWAQRVHAERGIEGIRVLMGLWHLGRRAGRSALERACQQTLDGGGALRLRHLRRLLEGQPEPRQLTFFDHHPVIRDLSEYGTLVAASATHPELPTAAPAGLEGPSGATVDNSCVTAHTGDASTSQEYA